MYDNETFDQREHAITSTDNFGTQCTDEVQACLKLYLIMCTETCSSL